ncbi:MAG TPA: hypothetical protein DHV62_00845 [Elusimicrobia bacterium]|jgi:hypothetical protein|nr:hypothetical protein [Elusimicrobiota bacterium]
MVKKKIFVLVLLCGFCGIFASSAFSTGTSGGEFLKIGVGGRAIGMGGAFSSIADNVTAVYWNPAGLTQLKMKEFSVMHLNYLVDIKSEYLSYAHPLGNPEPGAVQGKYGTLGSQLALLISHHSRRDDFGNEIGDFYNYEGVFSLAYGRAISKKFSLGLTLKAIYTQLDNDKTSNLAFDFGGLYKSPIEGINFSFVIQNIATGLKFTSGKEPISPDFKVGVSYSPSVPSPLSSPTMGRGLDEGREKGKGRGFILATDMNFYKIGKPNFSLGSEYSFVPPLLKNTKLSARIGYTGKASSTLGGLTGLTAGFGLEHKNKNFDYAFVPFGDLGNTHRFSLTLKF